MKEELVEVYVQASKEKQHGGNNHKASKDCADCREVFEK